jgi:hypothetical protein
VYSKLYTRATEIGIILAISSVRLEMHDGLEQRDRQQGSNVPVGVRVGRYADQRPPRETIGAKPHDPFR